MTVEHQTTDERNTGHGHVFPRPDGVKARCGGPVFTVCDACWDKHYKKKLARRREHHE